jgi:uncharacterized protein (DUF58 family)
VDRDELRARARRLTFASPALARAFARGGFRSVFRGRGIEFDSLREYSLEDDSRLIDWNAAARSGRPYIRTYREDRSLALFLVIDVSRSMEQGSGDLSKLDMAVLSSSLAAYAAGLRDMPVGCLSFSESAQRFLAPRRGKTHALAVGAAALELSRSEDRSSSFSPSPLADALDVSSSLLKRRSLVLVISDFRDAQWSGPLGKLRSAHDVVALRISDATDLELPTAGSFRVFDPETGGISWLPLASSSFRRRWKQCGVERRSFCRETCASSGLPLLEIDTTDDPVRALIRFFERRSRR